MGFIILQSNNNDMSYIIKKNPNTQPHLKKIKKGICMGYFHDINTYVMKFNDVEEGVSFLRNKDDTYDYLPYMQYMSPLLVVSVIRDMLYTSLNQPDDKDIETICFIEQAVIKLPNIAVKIVDKLNKFIKNYQIILKSSPYDKIYNFKISSQKSSLHNLLQYTYLVGIILNNLSIGYYEILSSEMLDKLIKIMNEINIPYYIRYIINKNMITQKEFKRVKPKLEGNQNIIMYGGDTQQQRFDFILNQLKFNTNKINIVDIGCGEGYYIKKLNKIFSKHDIKYYAYDIDTEVMDTIKTLIKSDDNNSYTNVFLYDDLDIMIGDINYTNDTNKELSCVILTEVIEHTPIDKIVDYLVKIFTTMKFHKIIITTPNVDFNKHYLLNEGELRHPDHVKEYNKDEFISLITCCIKLSNKPISMEYHLIGDTIDGISTTQCIIVNYF